MAPDIRAAARQAVSLALGRWTAEDANWPLVYEVSRVERLLGIAWLRSGDMIRARAPEAISGAWRRAAVEQDGRSRRQLQTLAGLRERFRTHDIDARVLKGPPLSLRLYGEIGARHCVDLDMLVAPDDRACARTLLLADGWTHWLGRAPWDECFVRGDGERAMYLEVHSLVPGEALAHCGPLHFAHEDFAWDGHTLDVAGGPALVCYIAANIAKHGIVPLSALVDFLALWSAQSDGARAEIARVARKARLSRCLHWTLALTGMLERLADGDMGAADSLGLRAAGRDFSHVYLRLIRLADRPTDAARVLASYVWPRPMRGTWRSLGAVWQRRLGKPLRSARSYHQAYVRG